MVFPFIFLKTLFRKILNQDFRVLECAYNPKLVTEHLLCLVISHIGFTG
jgi:hypothetical protein